MSNVLKVLCETLEHPLGVDNPAPRFSWYPDVGFPCLPQAGYRIRVTDETGRCAWDSGEMQDGTATMVPYRGEPLRSFTVYRVLVACTLTDGAVYCGETDLETGILEQTEWQGAFLRYPEYQKRQAPVFVWRFRLGQEIRRARAYFCGLGYGELTLNGHRTDNSVLDPAWTDYTRRVLYRTLDVTALLQALAGDAASDAAGTLLLARYQGERPLLDAQQRSILQTCRHILNDMPGAAVCAPEAGVLALLLGQCA